MKLKRTNKLLAWLLTLVMLVGLLPTTALAYSNGEDMGKTLSIVSGDVSFADKGLTLSDNKSNIENGSIPILYNTLVYIDLKKSDGSEINLDYAKQNTITVNTTAFDLGNFDGSNSFVDADGAGSGVQIRISITGGGLRFNLAKATSNNVTSDITVKVVLASDASGNQGFSLSVSSENETKGTVSEPIKTANSNEYYITATENPGYAFDHWEWSDYNVGSDTQPTTWAVYEDLKTASGSVTLTKDLRLRAHFGPASVRLGELTIGAVEELSDPCWAPTNPNAVADNIDFGGLDSSYLTQNVSGTPGIGEPAKLAFHWAPVGIVQGPNSAYYRANNKWSEFSAADNTQITMKLYAGAETSGMPIFEKKTTLWIDGSSNDITATRSGEWTGWGVCFADSSLYTREPLEASMQSRDTFSSCHPVVSFLYFTLCFTPLAMDIFADRQWEKTQKGTT